MDLKFLLPPCMKFGASNANMERSGSIVIPVCSFCGLQSFARTDPFAACLPGKTQTWDSATTTTRVARLGHVVAIPFSFITQMHRQC
jgi:hypothetical protein